MCDWGGWNDLETFLERVNGLRYVADSEAMHYDAIAETLVVPSQELPFAGICVLETGTVVEIKSVGVVYGASQRRGRFYLRRTQHEALLESAGVYLFAVSAPNPDSREIVAMKVVPATQVDHVIDVVTNEWRQAGDDRGEYVQLAWTRVFDPEEIAARGKSL